MKKLNNKIICIALCLIFSVSLFMACGNNEVESEKVKVIASFENYNELQSFGYTNSFGKIDVNADKSFVTEGNASAKLFLYGNEYGAPSIKVYSDAGKFDIKDFSKVNILSVDVYNAYVESQKVSVKINTFNKSKQRKTYLLKTSVVETNAWTTLDMPLDRAIAGLMCDLDSIESVEIEFEKNISDKAKGRIFYIDNLKINFTDEQYTPIIKNFEEKEVMKFNDITDIYFTTPFTFCYDSDCMPKLSLNRIANFAKSGYSLKVDASRSKHTNHDLAFSGFEFSASLINQINFSKIDPKVVPNGSIKFSVYYKTESKSARRLYIRAYDSGIGWALCWGDMLPNTWNEIELKATDLTKNNLSLKSIKRLIFMYEEICSTSTNDFSLYFDDFVLNY